MSKLTERSFTLIQDRLELVWPNDLIQRRIIEDFIRDYGNLCREEGLGIKLSKLIKLVSEK